MDGEALQELADSIREHGVLQPLIVADRESSEHEGSPRYQLIAGERRWRAAALAGLERVPVLVREATPRETLELALVENLQRADLNPLEEAEAYRQLIEEFALSQEQVAERVGRSRVTVTNALRLLRLPEAVRGALEAGRISEGHARALLGLPTAESQLLALAQVEQRGLSVRQTEEMVRRLSAAEAGRELAASREDTLESSWLEDRFRRALGTKVNLFRSKKGGRLVIHFYSEEELQSLYDRFVDESDD
jgi:ParB family chromosome partitioning protein